MSFKAIVLVFTALATTVVATSGVKAQSVPSPFPTDDRLFFRDDVAGNRVAVDADREGVDLGNFLAKAEVEASVLYDSNILNLPNGASAPLEVTELANLPLDDAVFVIDPRVSLSSRWQRHALDLSAQGRISRYADNGSFNNLETWKVAGRGRLDIGDASALFVDGAIGRDVEQRGASGVFFAFGDPITYREDRIGLGVSTQLGDIAASLSGGYLQRRYDPFEPLARAPISLEFRNIETWSVTPQLGYAIGPDTNLFVRGNVSFTRSLLDRDALAALGAANRDADGYFVIAGIRTSITPLLIVEAGAGWQKRDFADTGAAADFDGFAYTATLDWYPNPLFSLRLSSKQDFENSGLPDVPGILARDTALRAYFELSRQILLSADVDWTYREYRATPLSTDTWSIGARAEYRFNRHFSTLFFVRHRERTSNDSLVLPGYSGTIVGIAVESRL